MMLRSTVLVMVLTGSAFAGGGGSGSGSAANDQAAARKQAIEQAREAGILGTVVKGDRAKEWVRALKWASVKPTKAKDVRTFKVTSISCWNSTEGNDEQLGEYKCTLDKRLVIKDGPAYLLQNAMEGAGVTGSDHMSQHTTDTGAVTCTIDPGKAGDDRYMCTFSSSAT